MATVVRAFPVLPGKEEAVREFARTIGGPRQKDTTEFYRRVGVCQESWHMQDTPQGPWVIVVTDCTRPPDQVARDYAASQHPFDRWFKDQVHELSGIHPDKTPLGPPTEPLYSWTADKT